MSTEIRTHRSEYIYYEILNFIGWPKLNWLVTDNFHKSSKDWQPPPKQSEDIPAYVEVCHSFLYMLIKCVIKFYVYRIQVYK